MQACHAIRAHSFIVLLALLGGCASVGETSPWVEAMGAYVYAAPNGDEIRVTYYQLSDESLAFVKVVLPDGREFTLPQGPSASGARYTDDRSLIWWIKGESARVEMRNDQGEWELLYEEVVVASE